MKEFIEKLIGRLEEQAEQYRRRGFEHEQKGYSAMADKYYGKQCSYLHSIEIVNELAEEYINTSTDTSSGWIPCSERLPEEEDYYLVTKEDDIAYSIDIALWNPHYHWSNNGFHKADKVIAWQPLPEPYQQKEVG